MKFLNYRSNINPVYSFDLSGINGSFNFSRVASVTPSGIKYRTYTINISTSSILTTASNGASSLSLKQKLCESWSAEVVFSPLNFFHLGYTAPTTFRGESYSIFDPTIDSYPNDLFPSFSRFNIGNNRNIMMRRDGGPLGRWLLDGFLSVPYGTANWSATVVSPVGNGNSTQTTNYSGTTSLQLQFAPYRIVNGKHLYNHQFSFYDPTVYKYRNGFYEIPGPNYTYRNSLSSSSYTFNEFTNNYLNTYTEGDDSRGIGWGIKPWNSDDPTYARAMYLWNRASGDPSGMPGYYLQFGVTTGPMNIFNSNFSAYFGSKNNAQYKTGITNFPLRGIINNGEFDSTSAVTKTDAGSLSLNLSIT